MKKYETLKNEIAKALATEEAKAKLFAKINERITSEEIILNALNAKQLMHLMQFIELEKALKNAKYTLVHDSTFENCKAQTAETRVFSYIDSANKRVLHIYSHDTTLDIVFSSSKATLDKTAIAQQLDSDFTFAFKRDKKQNIKESKLSKVAFDNMLDAVKFATLILESSFEELIAQCEEEAKAQ